MPEDAELLALRKLLASTPDCAVTRPAKLQTALQAFVSLNEDASRSPNYQSQGPDYLDSVVKLLSSDAVKAHDQLLLCVLKMLKILTRKYDNRVRLGEHIVEDLVEVLHQRVSVPCSGEASNVVLNICYERDNVVRLVSAGGVPPLISFAKDDSNADLQANAAGAVQSICFQKEGRTFVREHGAIEAVLPLLGSANLKVQTRAVGAVHNMSSEPEAIRVIRRLGGVPLLIELLRVPSAPVCGSAAGALQVSPASHPPLRASPASASSAPSAGSYPYALRPPRPPRPLHSAPSARPPSARSVWQNLSRESASRAEILQLGAVLPLSDLLFGSDVQSQVRPSAPLRAPPLLARPGPLHLCIYAPLRPSTSTALHLGSFARSARRHPSTAAPVRPCRSARLAPSSTFSGRRSAPRIRATPSGRASRRCSRSPSQ